MSTRTIASTIAASVLGLSLAAQLTGCAGNGKYTTKFKEEAQGRMNMVKAGTEWDMANQQYESGDLDRALETVNTSLALNDKVAKSHLLKGKIMLELGRLEPAEESFSKAMELDPKFPEAPYYRGIIRERMERNEDALADFALAASLDRSNPQYTIAAAEVLMQMGRFDEAKQRLDPPAGSDLPRFSQNAGIRQTLGHIAMMQRDYPAAVIAFREAAVLAPGELPILEDLARAQLSAGDFAAAEANLARVLSSVKPSERRDLRMLRARCLLEIEKPVDARMILQELAQGEGASDPDVWVQLGNIAVVLEDDFRLREAGNRVVALAPRRHEGYLLLGLYQRRIGKPGAAAELLEKSAERSTADPTPAMVLALVYQQLGKPDLARQAAGRAVAISPDSPRARALAGQFGALADAPTRDQE
ncbi:MAG: tetratricopeptide repeat protein [Armatimonadetes bacterium]|nr:tetratricopeptide repeat protein [Armatimonadota bacterium]